MRPRIPVDATVLPCGHDRRYRDAVRDDWCLECERLEALEEAEWSRYEYAGVHVRDLIDDDELRY